jgi:hypothetical protein
MKANSWSLGWQLFPITNQLTRFGHTTTTCFSNNTPATNAKICKNDHLSYSQLTMKMHATTDEAHIITNGSNTRMEVYQSDV